MQIPLLRFPAVQVEFIINQLLFRYRRRRPFPSKYSDCLLLNAESSKWRGSVTAGHQTRIINRPSKHAGRERRGTEREHTYRSLLFACRKLQLGMMWENISTRNTLELNWIITLSLSRTRSPNNSEAGSGGNYWTSQLLIPRNQNHFSTNLFRP